MSMTLHDEEEGGSMGKKERGRKASKRRMEEGRRLRYVPEDVLH